MDDAELLAMMDAPMEKPGVRPSAPKLAATPSAPVPSDLADALRGTLSKYFGHEDFRGGQLEVIAAAVSGRDSCVYWSTGSGKSLCYQMPALHTGRTTLVVSPLVSLMQDQVIHLNNTAGAAVDAAPSPVSSARSSATRRRGRRPPRRLSRRLRHPREARRLARRRERR